MGEIIRVEPLRSYPGKRGLDIGESIEDLAMSLGSFPKDTELDGIPKRSWGGLGLFMDGSLHIGNDSFLFKATRAIITAQFVALNNVVNQRQKVEQPLIVPYSHALKNRGILVLIPNKEKIYPCYLIPTADYRRIILPTRKISSNP